MLTLLANNHAESYPFMVNQFIEIFREKFSFYSNNSNQLITMPATKSFNNRSNISIIEPYSHLRIAVISNKVNGLVESITLGVLDPSNSTHQNDFTIFAATLMMSLNLDLKAESAVKLLKIVENYGNEPFVYHNQLYQLFLTEQSFGLVATKIANN